MGDGQPTRPRHGLRPSAEHLAQLDEVVVGSSQAHRRVAEFQELFRVAEQEDELRHEDVAIGASEASARADQVMLAHVVDCRLSALFEVYVECRDNDLVFVFLAWRPARVDAFEHCSPQSSGLGMCGTV